MAMRKILVDETNRELCEHGTVGFPMTVNHDDSYEVHFGSEEEHLQV